MPAKRNTDGIQDRRYTDAQRDAVAAAILDLGITPHRRVIELAAAGDLTWEGEKLAPFTMPVATASALASRMKKKRKGQHVSDLAKLTHADAVQALRRRLINGADAMLESWERTARHRPDKADPERLRQIMRCVREAASLPGPRDPTPPKPGYGGKAERTGGPTRGGLAAQLIADHEATHNATPSETAHNAPPSPTPLQGGDDAAHTSATHTTTENPAQQGTTAGSLAHQRMASLG
jgi:hypothetical protein